YFPGGYQAMHADYHIRDVSGIFTPALVFYKDLIERNLARMIEMAREPGRLRPHVKTHKSREIIRLALQSGITKHKSATLAEAEMVAGCGAAEVFLAYNMVGPNCQRLARMVSKYPESRFAVAVDDADATRMLSDAMVAAGQQVEAVLDLDVGMHRTGI